MDKETAEEIARSHLAKLIELKDCTDFNYHTPPQCYSFQFQRDEHYLFMYSLQDTRNIIIEQSEYIAISKKTGEIVFVGKLSG